MTSDLTTYVGTRSEPVRVTWSTDDTILYALAVGAGRDPELDELSLTVEQSSAGALRALPSMAAALTLRAPSLLRQLDLGDHAVLHASQGLVLHRPLPATGEVEMRSAVSAVHDAGRGAILETTTTATDGDGPVFTATSQAFVVGAGGFGGPRATRPAGAPDRAADLALDLATTSEQALLYRLTGDRNPLHADPVVARRLGFARPVLHGLATLGTAVRLLLVRLGAAPEDVGALGGRFTGTVHPGDQLQLLAWREPGRVAFEVLGPDGARVIKDAEVRLRSHSA